MQSGEREMDQLVNSSAYLDETEDSEKRNFINSHLASNLNDLNGIIPNKIEDALRVDPNILSRVQNGIGKLAYAIDNDLIDLTPEQSLFAKGFAKLLCDNPIFATGQNAAEILNIFCNFLNRSPHYLNSTVIHDLKRLYNNLSQDQQPRLVDFLKGTNLPNFNDIEAKLDRQIATTNEPDNRFRNSADIVKRFNQLIEQEKGQDGQLPEIAKLAKEFNTVLQSGNPNALKDMYLKLSENGGGKVGTEKMYEILQYMINIIYGTVLIQPPDVPFSQIANQGLDDYNGYFQIPPEQLYRQLIFNKLAQLTNKAEVLSSSDSDFMGIKKDIKIVIMPNGQPVRYSVPSTNYESMNMFDWLKVMNKVISVERDSLELSYNVGYILKSLKNEKEGRGVMATIAEMASRYHPENLNWLNRLPGNTEITKGMMALVQSWKLGFMISGGIRNDELLRADVGSHFPAEIEVLEEQSRLSQIDQKDGNRLPLWQMRRGISLGKIGAYFREFMPWIIVSGTASGWNGENPGYKGEGDNITPILNPYDQYQQFFTGDAKLYGVPALPCFRGLEDPKDIADRFDQHYIDSRTIGFLPLRMDELFEDPRYAYEDRYQWVTKHNPFEQGGVDASGGSKFMNQYAPILREGIKDQQSILLLNELSINFEYGENVLRDGFKALENVGVDVVRNFCKDYVLVSSNFEDASKKAHLKSLFTYLFDRYFKDSHVNKDGFYSKFNNADEYWNYIDRNVFSSVNEIPPSSRARELRKHIFDALTVMLIERNPTEIVMMDYVHTSQNGVTFYRDIVRNFKNSGKWGDDDAQIDDNVKKAFKNLQLVEREVRQSITNKMLLSSQTKGMQTGSLFGSDFSQLRGFDYTVNVTKIREILTARGREDQVDKVIELYRAIMKGIWQKPTPQAGDAVLEYGPFKENQEAYWLSHDKHIIERMRFFSKKWNDGIIGIQFVESNADIFFDRAAQGSNLISSTANAIETITGTFKKIITSGDGEMEPLAKIISNFVRNGGQEGMKKIVTSLKAMYSVMKEEDPGTAKKATLMVSEMVIQALKGAPSLFSKEKASLAGIKVGHLAEEHTFGDEEIYELIQELEKIAIIGTESKNSEKKLVPISEEEVQKAKEEGREPEKKWVADLNSDVSAEAVLKAHGATLEKLFFQGLKISSLILLIALIYAIIRGAYDQYQS
jgi:hypothetical protein